MPFGKDYFTGKSSNYKGYSTREMEKEMSEKFALLDSMFKIKGKLLDVGCAFGYFLKLCDNRGVKTYGMDISSYAIKNARKYTKAKLEVHGAEMPWPFPDNFFDFVTMFDVVEHLNVPETAIAEASRVLKKGGVLHITTPNKLRMRALVGLFSKKYRDTDKTHINVHGISYWRAILRKHNFKIEYAQVDATPGFGLLKKYVHIDFEKIIPWFGSRISVVSIK